MPLAPFAVVLVGLAIVARGLVVRHRYPDAGSPPRAMPATTPLELQAIIPMASGVAHVVGGAAIVLAGLGALAVM